MRRVLVSVCLGLLLAPAIAGAQGGVPEGAAWAFRTRAVMTGVSDSSEPEGYKVYSGFGIEANVTRTLTPLLALSWTVATVSREVELTTPSGTKVNLGSIELLPVDVLVQFHLRRGGRFHPYLGAGIDVTPFFEKSGALDSTDLTVGVGPVFEAGFDYDLSPRMVFNVDFRTARMKTDLQADGARVATLALHPSTFGAGVGFRF